MTQSTHIDNGQDGDDHPAPIEIDDLGDDNMSPPLLSPPWSPTIEIDDLGDDADEWEAAWSRPPDVAANSDRAFWGKSET